MSRTLAVAVVLLTGVALAPPAFADPAAMDGIVEQYVSVPMPAEFRVEPTELEGPVFADAEGRTLYTWPSHRLRNGYSGETAGKPACYGEVSTETAGLMSPYPPGIALPDLDSRPSCTDLWPPVLAGEDAKPIGKWTIVERRDGQRQWMYDEQPLYTSVLDKQPGDTYGGTTRRYGGDSPAMRVPATPPPKVPPGFAIKTTSVGRLLTTDKNDSVYVFDRDTAEKSLCDGECAKTRMPVLAPQMARPQGEWSVVERSPGVLQWAFRQKPLYTYVLDQRSWSLEGSDAEGWNNVYTQTAPPPPGSFTASDTLIGRVVADPHGMTVYTYVCGDDSIDQLSCDHPNDTQVYRLAMCGGGDAKKCQDHWRYVPAGPNENISSRTWTVMWINPETGHRAMESEQNSGAARKVWAYRDRPVYTFGGDEQPGDLNGAGTGEWRGQRNGLEAIWIRDDYLGGTL